MWKRIKVELNSTFHSLVLQYKRECDNYLWITKTCTTVSNAEEIRSLTLKVTQKSSFFLCMFGVFLPISLLLFSFNAKKKKSFFCVSLKSIFVDYIMSSLSSSWMYGIYLASLSCKQKYCIWSQFNKRERENIFLVNKKVSK